jgi:hypothetical protein
MQAGKADKQPPTHATGDTAHADSTAVCTLMYAGPYCQLMVVAGLCAADCCAELAQLLNVFEVRNTATAQCMVAVWLLHLVPHRCWYTPCSGLQKGKAHKVICRQTDVVWSTQVPFSALQRQQSC